MSLFIESAQRAARRRDMVDRWGRGGGAGGAAPASRPAVAGDGAAPSSQGLPHGDAAGARPRRATAAAACDFDLDEAPGFEAPAAAGEEPCAGRSRRLLRCRSDGTPYSTAQEAYRDERAFDARRVRSRRRAAIARVLAVVVLTPIALVLLFLAAYATTCIVNGASPEELAELLGRLLERCAAFARDLIA